MFWVKFSLIIGLVPSVLFLIFYGLLTDWWKTFTGWVLFGIAFVTTASYGLSTVVAFWPDFWREDEGTAWRVIVRIVVATIMWALLVALAYNQRRARRRQ